MKDLRLLLVGLVVAMLTASAAVAAPPPGKGKPATTGEGCKPKVTVVLKGTVATASATSLAVDVTRANRWGRAYATAGSALVTVNADTKVRRNGKKTLADLVVGDRVLVQARACKADLAEAATPALTALRVVAHPAKT
jgi:opacity protein-like surface antigen